MPTDEYVCLKCGKEFELFQPMKDEALKVCTCGKKGRLRRKISGGGGLIFKGSGFYSTDYRSENYKQGAKNEKPAPASPALPARSKKTSSAGRVNWGSLLRKDKSGSGHL